MEKTRHNTASSTSTEYAQILSVPGNHQEDSVRNNFGDLDKANNPQSSDQMIRNHAGENESISGKLDIAEKYTCLFCPIYNYVDDILCICACFA